MTRKELERMRGLQFEIRHLEEKADKPGRTFVVDYYKDYRHNPKGMVKPLEGYDDGQAEAKKLERRIINLKKKRIRQLNEMEDFIASVEDPTMRTILRMYYRDGKKYKEIGAELGYSYNTNNLDEINEAGELLYKLAPNIRLIKDDFIQDDLVSGEVSAAVMYTSQVTMAKLADPSIEIVYPQEGIGFGIMGMFVPVNAPQPDAAHAFIDYILRPEVSAQCYEWLGYYCTNKASDDLISDEFKDFLVLPEEFNMEDMEMIGNISAEADSLMNEIWTQFKTLCGQA